MSRLKKPIAKRHSNTTQTKRQVQRAMKTTIPSSNASRKVTPKPSYPQLTIQLAFEVLSDPVKRRQFDSVDEGADVEPPPKKAKGDFFKLWNPFFASEARFSNRQPVPALGSLSSTRPEVEAFYNFWFTFDSWRSFEYLDKDPPDDGDNRDNKRWQEKKNKAERAKRKKEDTARLRRAVEDALAVDPRMKLFKEQEKKEKERKKWEREAGARKAAEEARLREEEEKKRKEEEEVRERAAKEDNKKSKEAAKARIKKEKRVIKGSVKDVNYFSASASAQQIDRVLSDVELIMERLKGEKLSVLAGKLDGKKSEEEVRLVFEGVVSVGDVKASEMKYFGKQVNGV
jgi:DnaJ family protein C protein 2